MNSLKSRFALLTQTKASRGLTDGGGTGDSGVWGAARRSGQMAVGITGPTQGHRLGQQGSQNQTAGVGRNI